MAPQTVQMKVLLKVLPTVGQMVPLKERKVHWKVD